MEIKKLPEAEFSLMQIIWQNPTPISTNQIIQHMQTQDRRKPQTILTLLSRLIERGFLKSERAGKDRLYTPLVTQEAYLAYESGRFMQRFHANSFVSLMNTLYEGQKLTTDDIQQIRAWLSENG